MEKNYRDYLKSEEWKKFKKSIPNKFCRVCKTRNKLHLHHKTYERIFNEDISDVEWLCEEHHNEIHNKKTKKITKKKKKKKGNLWELKRFGKFTYKKHLRKIASAPLHKTQTW